MDVSEEGYDKWVGKIYSFVVVVGFVFWGGIVFGVVFVVYGYLKCLWVVGCLVWVKSWECKLKFMIVEGVRVWGGVDR